MTTLRVEFLMPGGTDMGDVTERAMAIVRGHEMAEGDLRMIFHHYEECPSRSARDISLCTCDELRVEAWVLMALESELIMATGKYDRLLVEDDSELGGDAN